MPIESQQTAPERATPTSVLDIGNLCTCDTVDSGIAIHRFTALQGLASVTERFGGFSDETGQRWSER